ncbi:MAG: helix-turn-helix domain-containing protein [Clostridia bacterium]|nr:helix-turn-helix domain-containing protein [Clostridia bacterium]
MSGAEKRGYLNENFKLFHIFDKRAMDFDSHSHDFHKLIICLRGSVTYIIEGKTYSLSPWDVLLVPKDKIHHSKTDALMAYERFVLFISDSFLSSLGTDGTLSECFLRAADCGKCLYHASASFRQNISESVLALEEAISSSDGYANVLLADAAFVRLMVYINRLVIEDKGLEGAIADEKLDGIISYINTHFSEDLSIDSLSQKFYISRSGLMHKFKTVTGGSVHSYITQKRLSAALSMLRDGASASHAAHSCGFSDYTVFYKSFKKTYGYPPGDAISK